MSATRTTRPRRPAAISKRSQARGATRRLDSTEPLYVYALAEAGMTPFRKHGHRVEALDITGVFAVVERRTTVPEISERALREQHDIVVRLVRDGATILPVRFGALVDATELERVIRSRRAVLRKAFAAVRGKEQMTVRVVGQPVPPRQAPSVTSGTSYLMARAAAARVELPPVAQAIRRAVRPIVAAERVDQGRAGIAVTLNHLISRGRSSRYRASVSTALKSCEAALPVTVSGPWPPFAFVPDLWLPDSVVSRS